MSEVWDENWWGSTRTLDTHISTLRRKIGDDTDPPSNDRHRSRRRLPLRGLSGQRSCGVASLSRRCVIVWSCCSCRSVIVGTAGRRAARASRSSSSPSPDRSPMTQADGSGRRGARRPPRRGDGLRIISADGEPRVDRPDDIVDPIAVVRPVRAARDRARPDSDPLDERFRSRYIRLVLAAGAVLAAAGLATVQARQLARPLERLAATAARIGDGDFSTSNGPTTQIPEIDDHGAPRQRRPRRPHARHRASTSPPMPRISCAPASRASRCGSRCWAAPRPRCGRPRRGPGWPRPTS